MSAVTDHPKIDRELQALIPPLTEEERGLLKESLRAEGCRDSLVVWAQHNILLDGHNRLEICQEHGVRYTTKLMEFATRAEAVAWMVRNQLGRRNNTEEQKSYLRGRRYQEEKKEHGDATRLSQGEDSSSWGKTAEKLGSEYGVSDRTIHNDAAFAAAVDAAVAKATEAGEDAVQARAALLSGKATKTEVEEMAEKTAAELKQELAEIRQRKGKKIRRIKTAKQRRRGTRSSGGSSNGESGGDAHPGAATASKAAERLARQSANGTAHREPGDEEEPLTDQEGREVPEVAMPAFQQAGELNAVCRQIDDLVKEVERIGKSPAGFHLHFQSVQTHLKNAKNGLWTARPTHVCPYCKGRKKLCDACRGSGWVTASTYKAAPEETKKS